MKIIKEFLFNNLVNQIKNICKKIPITLFMIALLTTTTAIEYNFRDIFPTKILLHIYLTGSTFALGTLIVETLSKKISPQKILGFVISLFIALIFDQVFITYEVTSDFLYRLYFSYLIILIIATYLIANKKSKLSLPEYFLKITHNLFKLNITYVIMIAGICMVSSLFIILILDGIGWSFLLTLLIFATGLYYIPTFILSIICVDQPVSKFFKGIINYLLVILAEAATLILYLYFIKLIMNQSILHNQIYPILATLFLTCTPISLMAENFDNKNSKLFATYFKYLFIPLLFLQAYALGIRIVTYGLTLFRYLAIILLILEVLFIALYIFKNGKYLTKFYICLIIATLIFGITPLNIIDLPIYYHEHILQKFIDSNTSYEDLTAKEQLKYSSSYEYLSIYDKGKEFIENNLSDTQQTDFNKTLNYYYYYDEDDDEDEYYDNYEYILLDTDLYLDISAYDYIYEPSSIRGKVDEQDRVNLTIKFDDKTYSTDITDFINNMINTNEEFKEEQFKNNNLIYIENTNYYLYITYIYFEYDTSTNKINYVYSIEGYILQEQQLNDAAI